MPRLSASMFPGHDHIMAGRHRFVTLDMPEGSDCECAICAIASCIDAQARLPRIVSGRRLEGEPSNCVNGQPKMDINGHEKSPQTANSQEVKARSFSKLIGMSNQYNFEGASKLDESGDCRENP